MACEMALPGGSLCPQRTAIGKNQVRAWSAPPSCKYSLWGFIALSSTVLTSATLTSPGTLHFRKMSWVFIPWFPEISWSPNANFIILDSTHFKPASVISHKYTNNEVSSYQTHFAMFSWELVGQKLRTCLQTFFHFPITTFHTMHPHSY